MFNFKDTFTIITKNYVASDNYNIHVIDRIITYFVLFMWSLDMFHCYDHDGKRGKLVINEIKENIEQVKSCR